MINECTECGLHRYRRQEVVGRGAIPAEILFIGESPGKSEDLRGEPFVGPSGRILSSAIRDAAKIAGLERAPKHYITNTVRCRPTNTKGGPNRQPTEEEAWACWPKLREMWQRVRPQRVIFLGKIPERYCKKAMRGGIYMYHPSYILRSGGKRSSAYREFVRTLVEVFESIGDGNGNEI